MAWFKRTRTTVRKMTDFDGIKRQQSFLINYFRSVFKINKTQNPCNFEDLNKLGITKQKLTSNLHTFTWLYRFFTVTSILSLLYTAMLFYRAYYLGGIIAISVSLVFIAHAFKYHFWVFQIKTKKLGCSFGEWFNYLINYRGKL
ncbi:hypothetical protein L3V82_03975 [Thiotrichales bacterium 19S3-7]|nr:hypothetical protein [Thiotrichales bacterium 19S3-7]MCF6801832.1 hypothetical protein [Thiotrichales bacterium 19S3-11]